MLKWRHKITALTFVPELEKKLLDWYDVHRRFLPWRAAPGFLPNAYHVWLSEIMLQQTTVPTVRDYFLDFISTWPMLDDLAQALLDEVFHKWQGLGYYARARNLHKCAQILVRQYGSKVPADESVLLTLPGIGPYTAAAIAAIAHDQPVVPVDGNIIRVVSRLFALRTPLPALKDSVFMLVKNLVPSCRRGDFAQALMDLGSMVCRPRQPDCHICPLQDMCQGHLSGIAGQLPRPAVKAVKPTRHGIIFWVENCHGEILLEKRPDKGLLAGLMGLPTTSWQENIWEFEDAVGQAPCFIQEWQQLAVPVRHTFTHFHLSLDVISGKTSTDFKGIWCLPGQLHQHALPTLMKKVIQAVMTNKQKAFDLR